MSVVEAIANGVTKVPEIANRCYMSAKDIPKYLQVLQRLQLVQRVVPVTERKQKTKKAIYQISDNFFRFWFRFVNEDTRDILFAESKWQNKKVGISTYHNLIEKATRVEWHNDKRKEYFALFSKAGFTPELKKENVILFDLKEIEKHMGRF